MWHWRRLSCSRIYYWRVMLCILCNSWTWWKFAFNVLSLICYVHRPSNHSVRVFSELNFGHTGISRFSGSPERASWYHFSEAKTCPNEFPSVVVYHLKDENLRSIYFAGSMLSAMRANEGHIPCDHTSVIGSRLWSIVELRPARKTHWIPWMRPH